MFPETNYADGPDPLLDDIFNDPSFDPTWFDLDPDAFYSTGLNSCGFLPEVQSIVDEVDRNDLAMSIEAENSAPTPQSLAPFDSYVSPIVSLTPSDMQPITLQILILSQDMGTINTITDERAHYR